jgi:hypothetical protein
MDITDYELDGYNACLVTHHDLTKNKSLIINPTNQSIHIEVDVTLFPNDISNSRSFTKRTYSRMQAQNLSLDLLSKDLEKMRENEMYKDWTLVSNDGKEIKVHKTILAGMSLYKHTRLIHCSVIPVIN